MLSSKIGPIQSVRQESFTTVTAKIWTVDARSGIAIAETMVGNSRTIKFRRRLEANQTLVGLTRDQPESPPAAKAIQFQPMLTHAFFYSCF